ncbi:MAG: SDR family oxidoreductase [Rhodospirillales bacterium]|nr:SDR family oxidoreductase [Rhodospirillales bacterium]
MGTQRTQLDDITGKTALVTGAAGSIGAAITRFLAEDGVRVAAVDMDLGKLQEVTGAFEGDVSPYVMDVSKEAEVAAVMKQVRADLGDIDILVNVAGILSNNKLMETSAEEWHKIHAVNLDGPFFLSKEVLPAMQQAGWGRIVNIASYAWKSGGKTSGTAYSSSKAAIVGLTFAVAKQAAEFGVTVNGIAPAYVMSPMVTEQLSEEQRQKMMAEIPVRRFSEPEEIANCVRFLASTMSAFITGEIIDMNGGFQFD